jgi:hypothetical protein
LEIIFMEKFQIRVQQDYAAKCNTAIFTFLQMRSL